MQIIEFKSTSHNGVISIPDSYKDWYNNIVRVVLLREPKPLPQENDSTELKHFLTNLTLT
ncbi:hypothetical protein BGP_6564 [Beggiatoa sp. PS]|nr:hypothetical protein BGP_6564 [Beggiatoa sp. PS]